MSRLLRAAACRDPFAALQQIPGPEPLRGFAHAARAYGVSDHAVIPFLDAVAEFEAMIVEEAGDRSGFDAIIAAFLPEARDVFELKRKQAVFRAISQLKGVVAQTNLMSALIHPSADGKSLDILWISAYLGLQRLRPNVPVRFSTRRVGTPHGNNAPLPARRPLTIDGREVDGMDGLILADYCTTPTPQLQVQHAGDVMHYLLAGDSFGPRSLCDLTFAERNASEVPRYIANSAGKRRFVYTDVPIPVEQLFLDAIIHEDVLGSSAAQLVIYDTSTRGVADINDRSRDIDRLDLHESIRQLGPGTARCRLSQVPWYDALLADVYTSLNWDASKMIAHRVAIDYPLHATQVAVTYAAQEPPEAR